MSRLYVVGTPIGNLSDLSPRAAATLGQADFIAAEDTRVTVKLLNHLGLKKPMVSYYEHNRRDRGSQILARIQDGETCALVSDAGMPAISDPGEELVRLCRDSGVPVEVVPGPSALVAALAASGLPAGRFCFEGFLSINKNKRRDRLQELKTETRTMIFYEAPHKLLATLKDFHKAFGDRTIGIARELTKIHEEVVITTLSEAAKRYEELPPKGEFVLILPGAAPEKETSVGMEDAAALAAEFMKEGYSSSEAAKKAARETGRPKSEIYRMLVGRSGD